AAVSDRSRISTGSTTFTTVASMMMMDTARATMAIAFQRLAGAGEEAADELSVTKDSVELFAAVALARRAVMRHATASPTRRGGKVLRGGDGGKSPAMGGESGHASLYHHAGQCGRPAAHPRACFRHLARHLRPHAGRGAGRADA